MILSRWVLHAKLILKKIAANPVLKPVIWLIVFLALLALYLWLPPASPERRELLLVVVVVALVHVVARLLLLNSFTRLIDQTADTVSERLSELSRCANFTGLNKIYDDREKAARDIVESIKAAGKRIWLLGIAFQEPLRLKSLIPFLRESKAEEIKLLLLDPLRTPARFPAVFECGLDAGGSAFEAAQNPPGNMQSFSTSSCIETPPRRWAC